MSDFTTLSLVKRLFRSNVGSEKPVVGSYLDKLMNKDSGQTFDPTTDSLEMLSEKFGVIKATSRLALPKGTPVGINSSTGQLEPIVSPFLGGEVKGQSVTLPTFSNRTFARLSSTLVVFISSTHATAGVIGPNHVITWGTPVAHQQSSYAQVVRLSDTSFVVCGRDSSNYPQAIVGTVSGTTITFGGSLTVAKSSYVVMLKCCALGDNKFVLAYYTALGSPILARAATVSSYTITYGTEKSWVTNVYASGTILEVAQTGTDEFSVIWNTTSTGYYTITCCTVSGTTITTGTHTQIAAVAYGGTYSSSTTSSDHSLVVAYLGGAYLYLVAITVVGTTPTIGTPVSYSYSSLSYLAISYEYGDTTTIHMVTGADASYYSRCTRSGTTLTTVVNNVNVAASGVVLLGGMCIPEAGMLLINTTGGTFTDGDGVEGIIINYGCSYLSRVTLVGILASDVEASAEGVVLGSPCLVDGCSDLATVEPGMSFGVFNGYVEGHASFLYYLSVGSSQHTATVLRYLGNNTLHYQHFFGETGS